MEEIKIANPERGFNVIEFEKKHNTIEENIPVGYNNYISRVKEEQNIEIVFMYVDKIPEKKYKYKHKITGELFDEVVYENGKLVAPMSWDDFIYTVKDVIYLYMITKEDITSFERKDMWENEKQLMNLFLSYCDENNLLNLENITRVSLEYNCVSEWKRQKFLNENIKKIEEYVKCKYSEVHWISYRNHGVSENLHKTTIKGVYTNVYDAEKYEHNKTLEIKKYIFEYIKTIDDKIYSSLEDMPFYFYGQDRNDSSHGGTLYFTE